MLARLARPTKGRTTGVLTALGATLLLLVGSTAHANPRAEQLAKEAGDLMFKDPPRYQEAIEKYHQAIVLSPEGKYYFNLCVAYYQMGEFGLALQACDAVETAGADEALRKKTAGVTGQIEGKIRALGRDPNDLRRGGAGGGGDGAGGGGDGGGGGGDGGDGGDGGGDGGGGGGIGGGGGGTGQPVDTSQFRGAPPPSLYTSKPPGHDYTWTLGGSLYGASSKMGRDGGYGSGGAGFRLHADYLIAPAARAGVQGYLGFTTVGKGRLDQTLDVVDFGIAGYLHVMCSGRVCLTPLAGVHIAGFQPEGTGSEVRMASLGVRAEASLSFAVGTRYEHVLSVTPGFNIYLPAVGDYDAFDPMDYGLDRTGTTAYLGFGYTYRFDTPFGASPFITLE